MERKLKTYKLRKPGEAADQASGPIDIPELIRKIGEIQDKRNAFAGPLESEEKVLKAKLHIFFRSAGIKTAEGGEFLGIRVVDDGPDFSKGALEQLYGAEWVRETEEALKAAGLVKTKDYMQIKRKPKKGGRGKKGESRAAKQSGPESGGSLDAQVDKVFGTGTA